MAAVGRGVDEPRPPVGGRPSTLPLQRSPCRRAGGSARTAEVGEARDEPVERAGPRGQRAAVGGQARERLEAARRVERGQSSCGALGSVSGPSTRSLVAAEARRAGRVQRREAATEQRVGSPRAPPRRSTPARGTRAGGSSARRARRRPASRRRRRASAGPRPRACRRRRRVGGGLDEDAAVVLELGGVGVVEVAAGDPAQLAGRERRAQRVTQRRHARAARRAGRDTPRRRGRARGRSRRRRRSRGPARRGRFGRAGAGIELAQQAHLRGGAARGARGAAGRARCAIERDEQVEVVEVREADLARAAGRWIPRARRRPRRARVRRRAGVPAAGAGAVDLDLLARGRPRATSARMTPSAVGERQMLPMQTNRTRVSGIARSYAGDGLGRELGARCERFGRRPGRPDAEEAGGERVTGAGGVDDGRP